MAVPLSPGPSNARRPPLVSPGCRSGLTRRGAGLGRPRRGWPCPASATAHRGRRRQLPTPGRRLHRLAVPSATPVTRSRSSRRPRTPTTPTPTSPPTGTAPGPPGSTGARTTSPVRPCRSARRRPGPLVRLPHRCHVRRDGPARRARPGVDRRTRPERPGGLDANVAGRGPPAHRQGPDRLHRLLLLARQRREPHRHRRQLPPVAPELPGRPELDDLPPAGPRRVGHLDVLAVHEHRLGARHLRVRSTSTGSAATPAAWRPSAAAVPARATPSATSSRPSRIPGTVRLQGWTIDPDTTGAVGVHVYVDGVWAGQTTADVSRADVGAAYPGWSANHGFAVDVPVGPGDPPGLRLRPERRQRVDATPSSGAGRSSVTRSAASTPRRRRRRVS